MGLEQIMTLLGVATQVITMVAGGLYALNKIDRRLELLVQETGLRHTNNLEKFTIIDSKLNELVVSNLEMVKQGLRMDHVDGRVQELSNRLDRLTNGHNRAKPRQNKG